MAQLSDNLLKLVRGQIPLISVQRVALDLEKIVQDVAKRFDVQAQEKTICIDTRVETPPEMHGGPLKLSLVISNLIGNTALYYRGCGVGACHR